MKLFLLVLVMTLPLPGAWAGQQTLVSISDPPGDDYGAGTLTYPQRIDFQTGDLDLLQLKVSRDEEGFWFEAAFKNPVRDPADVTDTVSSRSLAIFARKGFYQFNIDIYVDTDRAQGSGNTFTLPGRNVLIDPAYAWERAVILTPRPELMRQQLLDAVTGQAPGQSEAQTEAAMDQSMFFPTRIRVRGKSIAFFVPAGFFSGSDRTDWAITAMVTGAMTSIPAGLSLFPSTTTALERLQLGVMQPVAGSPKDTFGYSGAIPGSVTPGPVVDLLGPSAEQQKQQLMVKENVSGVSWGQHAADDTQSTMSAHESASPSIARPVASIGQLFQQEKPAIPSMETGPGEIRPPVEPSIAKRLQTLQQLLDQKLIDDEEYRQQKQRILNDL